MKTNCQLITDNSLKDQANTGLIEVYENQGNPAFHISFLNKSSLFGVLVSAFLGIITLGFTFLLEYHFPKIHTYIHFKAAKKISDATHFLIIDNNGYERCIVKKKEIKVDSQNMCIFDLHGNCYAFNHSSNKFYLHLCLYNKTHTQILNLSEKGTKNICEQDFIKIQKHHSRSAVIPHLSKIFLYTITQPVYACQIYFIIFWTFDGFMASRAFFVVIVFLNIRLHFIKSKTTFKDIVQNLRPSLTTICIRNKTVKNLSSESIKPGDYIVIEKNMQLPCDAILIQGQVDVNEMDLTGTTQTIKKVPLSSGESQQYHNINDCLHTLYCGSKVIDIKTDDKKVNDLFDQNVIALVTNISIFTLKGRKIKMLLKNTYSSLEDNSNNLILFLIPVQLLLYLQFCYISYFFTESLSYSIIKKFQELYGSILILLALKEAIQILTTKSQHLSFMLDNQIIQQMTTIYQGAILENVAKESVKIKNEKKIQNNLEEKLNSLNENNVSIQEQNNASESLQKKELSECLQSPAIEDNSLNTMKNNFEKEIANNCEKLESKQNLSYERQKENDQNNQSNGEKLENISLSNDSEARIGQYILPIKASIDIDGNNNGSNLYNHDAASNEIHAQHVDKNETDDNVVNEVRPNAETNIITNNKENKTETLSNATELENCKNQKDELQISGIELENDEKLCPQERNIEEPNQNNAAKNELQTNNTNHLEVLEEQKLQREINHNLSDASYSTMKQEIRASNDEIISKKLCSVLPLESNREFSNIDETANHTDFIINTNQTENNLKETEINIRNDILIEKVNNESLIDIKNEFNNLDQNELIENKESQINNVEILYFNKTDLNTIDENNQFMDINSEIQEKEYKAAIPVSEDIKVPESNLNITNEDLQKKEYETNEIRPVDVDGSEVKWSKEEVNLLSSSQVEDSKNTKIQSNEININSFNNFQPLFPSLVIDNSTQWCRAGLSDQQYPQINFLNVIGTLKSTYKSSAMNQVDYSVGLEAAGNKFLYDLKSPFSNGYIESWDDMVKIWENVYEKQLAINSEDFPVLIAESAINSMTERCKLAQTFFDRFYVPKFFMAHQSILSLYSVGNLNGLVIDSGDNCSATVPIYEGYGMWNFVQKNHISGKFLTDRAQRIFREVNDYGYNFSGTLNLAKILDISEEIKKSLCYVAQNYQLELENIRKNNKAQFYTMPDGEILKLAGEVITIPEILFDPHQFNNPSVVGLHEMAVATIENCDIEIKKILYENIVLSGGTTRMSGFRNRIISEIENLKKKHVRVKEAKEDSAWIGGAILANLDSFSDSWITRQEWDDAGLSIIYRKCIMQCSKKIQNRCQLMYYVLLKMSKINFNSFLLKKQTIILFLFDSFIILSMEKMIYSKDFIKKKGRGRGAVLGKKIIENCFLIQFWINSLTMTFYSRII